MTDSDQSLDELKAASQKGSRLESAGSDTDSLRETIADRLRAIDRGDAYKNLSVRDETMAGIVLALEEHPERMTAVGKNLARALDREPAETYDRSEVLRLALRLGFDVGDPALVEEAKDAARDVAAEDL